MTKDNDNIIKPEVTKLNIGCGFKKLDDHWNVDIESRCNPDQVLDLEVTPWPYEDNFFDRITANHILESIGQNPKKFIDIIKEMYRVSKNESEWYIRVSHHRSDTFWNDPTKVRPVTEKVLNLFDQKFNFETIAKKMSDNVFGLHHNIDLEISDITYNLVDYWVKQIEEGMIGHSQLNTNLNTLSNVCESVDFFIKVHKPGRFEDWVKKNNS